MDQNTGQLRSAGLGDNMFPFTTMWLARYVQSFLLRRTFGVLYSTQGFGAVPPGAGQSDQPFPLDVKCGDCHHEYIAIKMSWLWSPDMDLIRMP